MLTDRLARVLRLGFGLVLWMSLTGEVDAQRPPGADKGWRDDPYTRNEAQALSRVGYVSLGARMTWGDDHGTHDIEAILGAVPLLWLETAHFKIGSSLPEYKLVEADKKSIQAELKQLKQTLPRVKDRARTLDPWLRLHLYAWRLERAYAGFQELLGVTDADFPKAGEDPSAREPFMGNGPYLGRTGKYVVLLLEKKSSLGRYDQRFGGGRGTGGPLRLSFHGNGSLGFATAEEFFEGRFATDVALHTHVVFNLVCQFLDGFKDYYHISPRWLAEGLAYGFMRDVDSDYPTFTNMKESFNLVGTENNWGRKVRARVKVEYFPAAAELMHWTRDQPLEFANHTMMWSRVDFLRSLGDDGLRRFLHAFKAPIPVEGRSPTVEEVFARQDEAMQAELGFDAEGFDEAWVEWVLDSYPRR